ncbi:MAG: zinc ribbon domain-containing protein [Gemmatimonadales bacterium]|nr:MAG: zinc ribbon domain-containing protein [Gemmatimonadales bacterium]
MPTYEYRCKQCGVEFERIQKMSDPHVDECPECKGTVQRLISKGGGLLFKGTGFYATDYRSGSPSSASEKSESGSTGGKSAGESGSTGGKSAGESGSTVGKSASRSRNGSTKE